MPRKNSQQTLIDAGLATMRLSGYGPTGIQEIVDRSNVPKGSFYHHFGSKERFGECVVSAYFENHFENEMRPFLNDAKRSPRQRLLAYFKYMSDAMIKGRFRCGCLVGNFALETSDTSKVLQQRVSILFASWRQALAQCIRDAQAAGEVSSQFPAQMLAEFLLVALEGGMLRAKADRDRAPLDAMQEMIAERILVS